MYSALLITRIVCTKSVFIESRVVVKMNFAVMIIAVMECAKRQQQQQKEQQLYLARGSIEKTQAKNIKKMTYEKE